MTDPADQRTFRLAYVPGVTPAKWVRIWNERMAEVPLELIAVDTLDAEAAVRSPRVDVGLVRLPVDRTGLSVIRLYEETTVVVVPKDHLVTAVPEVALADLDEEVLVHPLDDPTEWPRLPGTAAGHRPATTEDAIELVAAGVGVLIVPQSLARLYHRRDLTYRPVTDAPVSVVALVWPADETTDLVDEFVGIVRGRTANSSRGARPTSPPATSTTPTTPSSPRKKARAERTPPQSGRPRRGTRGRGGSGPRGGKGRRR
ncbi:LysR family substrate-binding domain-containing protein [Rhodococcus triatomae]|uniref:LysR substrate binding domain-containing protein n=1 Tax=Rhodococcus triatomae TaxID=300028 RepID=A0A1G8MT54_9NOCA|nr:LysR family substrate-binding domain-containing protein [Rhodococcus triatomae]QNG19083.1 LysR family substrate-binding domain-containing protein [Rhodococcus triatomae]QNG25004.1 LysR family substrate-binding domain-containing protein [Rhodococcus triatomae]SDI71084.1 LysR substrate binding domain-containing protein [Rhodococcus triatomae]